jgi:hypothetical protein
VGQVFFNTGAPVGANLYSCTSANAWSAVGLIPMGGDTSGTAPATTVTGLQNRPVSSASPSDQDALRWNAASGLWAPEAVISVGSGTPPVTCSTGGLYLRSDTTNNFHQLYVCSSTNVWSMASIQAGTTSGRPANCLLGQTWLATDTGAMTYCSATGNPGTWSSTLAGPAGPQGPAGPLGGANGQIPYNYNGTAAGSNLSQNTDGSLSTNKAFNPPLCTVTLSTTPAFDASQCNAFSLTLGSTTVTSSTLLNAKAGQNLTFTIVQDATGGRSFVWPTNLSSVCSVNPAAHTSTAVTAIFDGTNANATSCTTSDSATLIAGPTRSAPGTPSTGLACWFDSTANTLLCKDPNGNLYAATKAVSARTANQFLTYVDASGAQHAAAIVAADVPTLNQSTTGTAAGLTAAYVDWNASSGGAFIQNKPATFAPVNTGNWAGTWQTYSPSYFQTALTNYSTISGLSGYPSTFPPTNTGNWAGTWQTYSPSYFQTAFTNYSTISGLMGYPATFTPTPHNLLSASHGDTTAASAVRGDGLFATGATPTWQRLAHPGTSGGYFKWNGTDIVASTGAASGTGSCANQAVTAANADSSPTCSTITSAYVDTSIAKTGTDINTSNQVTVTHLSSALPVNQGGTGNTSTLTGLMRGNSSALTAAELSGDCTTSGSNAMTCTKLNNIAFAGTSGHLVSFGAANIPADSGVVAANTVVASSPGAGIAHFAGGTQTVTSSPVSLAADVSGTLPVANLPTAAKAPHSCDMAFGDTSASSVLTNAQLGPQVGICFIPAAATVVEIDVRADGGTPQIVIGQELAGTVLNLTSAALATAASGARACSKTTAVTGLDGSTTCSATLQNTALAPGAYLQAVSGTAGGTAKWMTVHVIYNFN